MASKAKETALGGLVSDRLQEHGATTLAPSAAIDASYGSARLRLVPTAARTRDAAVGSACVLEGGR